MTFKRYQRLILTAGLALSPAALAGLAEAAGDTNTTLTIKKGDEPDFTIVSDSEEVSGDPFVPEKEARDSWKAACTQWKNELRELNKDNQIVAMNCGSPKASAGINGATLYSSTATYKIRVRVRSEAKAVDPVKAAK